MNDQSAEQYVRYREHIAARDEVKNKLQELEIQYARLSASLMHLPEEVRALTAAVQALTQRVPEAQGQQSLGLHHLADEIRSFRDRGNGGLSIERWLLLAAFGGAGFMLARFLTGGG